jgi:DNA-nicking Smr family endonuclease
MPGDRNRVFPGMSKRRRSRPAFESRSSLADDSVSDTIDLHGLTAVEARQHLGYELRRLRAARRGRIVQIITGKGRHSTAGPVLRPLVRTLLLGTMKHFVAEMVEASDGGGYLVRLA